ncbi:ribonucleoprotein PTB-binding 1 isoform X2 [Engraulis encrasicolus]|uniref:ribonucleoprotein PTB-binding 1 isoform X2 n=1 Tax=Engraulis encrasicolus TaxID=184585 RepID=UPI002FD3B4F6
MAAAVSVSAAARDEKPYAGPNCGSRPLTLYENYGEIVQQEQWGLGERSDPDAESTDENASTSSESQRRADDELPVLSPEEIECRLERTRREFYNRRKIIIKNLPNDITNQEVHELLSNYDLKYCFVDKYKGTAFVTLLNGEQAQHAISQFHQFTLREREISVQLQPTDALLCIANLPTAYSQQQFEELVRPFGNLERCFLVHSASTGHSKGYGFVEYMKKDSAARAKSELLGKQLGSRMLYVHWTEVGSLTFPMLHSRCLCIDRLPPGLLSAPDLLAALSNTHAPLFCQLAQGQDGSFRRFAVLEFSTPEMAEEAQRVADGRTIAGTHIRVSFCAPGPPGRSMLAALIAAQTMALNRGKGLLPEPTAMQILTGLSNPATLKMLLNPLTQGRKQGLLGAAPPAMPLLANPALSAALLQMLLQNQAQVQQQAGLLGENPLATHAALQQSLNMLGELPQSNLVPGLTLPTESLGPIKPPSMGRPLAREQESPTPPCSFPSTPSPALQGLPMTLLGGMLGAEAPAVPGSLRDPLKEVGISQNPFLNNPNVFPSAVTTSRPHPYNPAYRKRATVSSGGSAHSQRSGHTLHSTFNLRYQDSYTPEYPPLHQDPLSHLYEPESLDCTALPGFGVQPSRPSSFGEQLTSFHYPPSPPQSQNSYYGAYGAPVGATQLNKAVGMPPLSHSSVFSAAPGSEMKTPVGGQKRLFSRLIPSPEPSPEGGYVGQHSQGLGGHYADSYLKRKRIF